MKKENLKRLKALLLAITMCLSLTACNKDTEKSRKAIVIFIQGKALICSGEYEMHLTDTHVTIIKNSNEIVKFILEENGAVRLRNEEDAIELATTIVGKDNIICIDYKDDSENMEFTPYTKTLKK